MARYAMVLVVEAHDAEEAYEWFASDEPRVNEVDRVFVGEPIQVGHLEEYDSYQIANVVAVSYSMRKEQQHG